MNARRRFWMAVLLTLALVAAGVAVRRVQANDPGTEPPDCPPCYVRKYDPHTGDSGCVPNKGDCVEDGPCGSCPSSTPCSVSGVMCSGYIMVCSTPNTKHKIAGTGTQSTQSVTPCYRSTRVNCQWSSDVDPVNHPLMCPENMGGMCCVSNWGGVEPSESQGSYTECCDCS
jgi:hypothetical protein